MRVLLWTEGFWPHIGGVAVISAQHVVALQERGHDCLVVTSLHDAGLPYQELYRGVPVYRFAFSQALVRQDLTQIKAIRQEIAALKAAFQPDIIHINEVGPSTFFHLLTEKTFSAPTVMTIQSILPQTLGRQGLLVQMLQSAGWVAAVSQAMLDDIRRLVPEITPRSSLIYNGRATPRLQPTPLSPEAFDAPRLLCLGRVVDDKGFDVALAAFAALAHRFPLARLIIAGDGEARPRLEQQASELGLTQAVEFLGWIAPERVPSLIDTVTLVVMPSRWREPFGLVALEAGLMERPVVATRVGGLAEVVADGETGLLVENEDVTGLADAIAALLSHPATAIRMGQAGRRRAQERFSAERFVEAHETVYRHLVGGSLEDA